jgi:hypothetical protein
VERETDAERSGGFPSKARPPDRPNGLLRSAPQNPKLSQMDKVTALIWIGLLLILELTHLKWIWWTYWDCRRCGRKNHECAACGRAWILFL